MARQKDLHSGDVDKLEDSINDLKAVAEQMVESFESLENQTTCMADQVSTLQSNMSSGRNSLQTDLEMLIGLKGIVNTYVSEIRNKDVGSSRNKQNLFLQNTIPTIEKIREHLESIKSNLEAQNDGYDSQRKAIEIMQNKWFNERSVIDENGKSLRQLIIVARESLLVATAGNIGWEISRTRIALNIRIRWLWGSIGAVIIGAIGWVIFGPTLSSWIVTEGGLSQSSLSSWEAFLLGRVSIPIVLSAPYFLLKKSLDSTSEEARLYQHKEVMLKTLIVFRDNLDEEDQASKNVTINKMIEAISIPPSSRMTEEEK